jgi:hypothetical protein
MQTAYGVISGAVSTNLQPLGHETRTGGLLMPIGRGTADKAVTRPTVDSGHGGRTLAGVLTSYDMKDMEKNESPWLP